MLLTPEEIDQAVKKPVDFQLRSARVATLDRDAKPGSSDIGVLPPREASTHRKGANDTPIACGKHSPAVIMPL